MTTASHATDRPFTLVVCTGCAVAEELSVLDELRGTIRRCPHGVLVAATCMVGPLTCAARHDGPGALVLVQPCSHDRSPVGTARWIGPVNDRRDAAAVGGWVERGDWDVDGLPGRLRSRVTDIAHVAGQN